MNKNSPNDPIRKIELRIEMVDPDRKRIGVKAFVDESYLTDPNLDPRDVLFKALQDMSHKIVSESFPAHLIAPRVRTETQETQRAEQNEAIADMVKLPLVQKYLNGTATDYQKEN